ncbi:MAG: hypothetical protein GY798_28355 [Hyphomicrobiales bacterium]|nr:hypothetical protein [Hyphomicrobiales bacterium]
MGMLGNQKITSARRHWSISTVCGLVAAAAMAVGITGGTASSADLSEPRVVDFSIVDEDPATAWEFDLALYAWLTSINGQIKSAGEKIDIDVGFIDLVEESDYLIPLMGYMELRNGRFSLFADGFYTESKFSKSGVKEKTLIGDAKLKLKAKGSLVQTIAFAELGATYEVARGPGPAGSTATLDLLAGARYWYFQSETKFKLNPKLNLKRLGLTKEGNFAVSKTGELDWIDPVIGARVRKEFDGAGALTFLGDIGGFGVGSEFTWQAFAGYSGNLYVGPTTTVGGMIGYRAMSFDYKGDSNTKVDNVEMLFHGPIASLNFKW